MIKDDVQPSLLVKGHPDRANSCAKLAVWLWNRFKQTGDLVLLDEAIELEREVVRLRPEGHPDRALSCADLAVSLTTCFERTRDMPLLDETIELEREALRLRPDGHADRAETCRNLAISLRTRFDQTEDMDMLDEALDLEREALRLRPEGHPNRADICGDLAIALWNRFSQTADMRLLDEAITLLRESLRLRPEEHPDYADSCANLSVALTTCFSQTGDSALLDEAIKLQREALRLRPEGHPERAISCANLAVSVWTRFGHTGDMPLLEESVELLRESLRLRPKEHPDRAISCANLAASLWTRFSQTKDMGLLHEALQFDREALRLRPEGHPDRADSCNNLAISLRTCFTETGDTVLLDEALELHREGLRLRPVEHRDRASVCADMALSLRIRFDQTGDTMLLDEARSLCTQTIEQCSLSPSDHVCLRVQLAHIHALPAYASFNPSAAVTYLSEAIQYRAGMIRNFYSFTYALHLCAKATVSDEDHVRLLAVYQAAIEVLPEMGNAILPKISRLHRWQNAGNLPLEALFQALKANDLPAGLELVEQGRAVLWSETLAMQDTQLQGLPVELKEQLQKLLQSLSTVAERGDVQHSDLSARDQAHTSYTQLQQLLKNIRASAGLERFMRGPVYSDLLQVAHTHPAVLLFASTTACHALVISSASVSPAHLILKKIATTDLDVLGHDIRGLDLNIRAMCGLSCATEERGISIDGRRVDPAVRKLHQALKRLWIDIVKPILDCLSFTRASGRDRPRVHWCPIGSLVFLPIHAAGVYSQSNTGCCSDYVVSTYTPTLSALRRARMGFVPKDRQSLVVLAAAAPNTTASLDLPYLDSVRPEIAHVAQLARATGHIEVLEYGHTSSAQIHEVAAALPRVHIAHLACHGVQDQEDPLNSGFCLGDGKLTVSNLMDIKLEHAFLAFLSACETAKGDKNQPDQAIHLAAAMLFCGFRSVVATMWSISDVDGPAVALAFYQALLAEEIIDADTVAYALDDAISKLRGKDVSPIRWASFIHVGA